MVNVAIFVRVSKQTQEYDRQISELTDYAKSKNYNIISVISEKVTGSKKNKDRQGVIQLRELAKGKKIKKVLVSEVSRLGRNVPETDKLLNELSDWGVSVYTKHFNLETLDPDGKRNPLASLIFGIMKELASYEREMIRFRILSGQEEARKKGKIIGRPKGATDILELMKKNKKYQKVIALLKENLSIRNISKITEVSTPTIQKIKKHLR